MILGYSELPWVGRIPCHFNVDLPADVHPCTQSKIHAIGAIDELLELLRRDALANFPDAEGRTLRSNRAERMVVKTRFEVLSDCLVPTTTGSHRCLRGLPPLLRFASAELMVHVEKLGCHGAIVVQTILNEVLSPRCCLQHSASKQCRSDS